MRPRPALDAVRARGSTPVRVAISIALVLVGTAFAAGAAIPGGARVATDGVRYSVEHDGLRLEFHAVLGFEALYDARDPAPSRNLVRERAEDAARLRRILLEDQGVGSVDDLRARHRATIESLRHLGYL